MMRTYHSRRQQLLQHIGSDGLAILFAAPEQRRSNDTEFPFRQDSYLHYLSSFPEPQAALILDGASGDTILFCREKDSLMEIWNGFRYGPEAAKEAFAVNEAHPFAQWPEILKGRLKGHRKLYALWGLYPDYDAKVMEIWHQVQQSAGQRAATGSTLAPDALMDLSKPLNAMRLVKDAQEQALLRQAADISAHAHLRAMRRCQPGQYEYQLEAEFLHEFMYRGARSPAYNSIVGGGKNACCLHYVENKDILRSGDLVLIDAGAEYQGYAGDITRTFPVNGRFSGAQKEVYETVLSANTASIEAIRPGADWQAISQNAIRILTQGLIDLQLLNGSLDGNIEQQTYRRFYMHGLGHWLGLDVHDVGGRFENEQPILLREGMYTTVEPGLYIAAAEDIPPAFHNIGIRIEDNIIVTANGCENYTSTAPKSIADIEQTMQG